MHTEMNLRFWQMILGVLPAGVIVTGISVTFGIYLWTQAHRGATVPARREGSAVLPAVCINFFYWLCRPLVHRLGRWHVRPNHITYFSLATAILAATAFGFGDFLVGAWLFALASTCDVLDGFLAREFDLCSESGAFLDSVTDRVAEGAIYLGLAVYGEGGWLSLTSIAALIGSYLVSYSRARGEALGADCAVGLMQRPERMFLLLLAVFAAPFVAMLVEPQAPRPHYYLVIAVTGAIALLSLGTTLTRGRWILRQLRDNAGAAASKSSDGEPLDGRGLEMRMEAH